MLDHYIENTLKIKTLNFDMHRWYGRVVDMVTMTFTFVSTVLFHPLNTKCL